MRRLCTTLLLVHTTSRRAAPSSSRLFSTTTALGNGAPTKNQNTYANTLILPKTPFPLWADPVKSELPFRTRSCEELYRWQERNAKGPSWVLHDGPPYANGDLHMGHALNKILKDIINRFHVSQGRRVHYIPGWDCHGLPIENKTLQELGQDSRALPANVIRTAAEATAKREIASQKEQFRYFGIMADWGSDEATYRTLDHAYEMRQLRIFQKMVEKGLIYRHYRPVHYSPSSRSALAEAELVYKDDHVSHSVFVTFVLAKGTAFANTRLRELVATVPSVRLLVWTTTPWTLTANMGIAVHRDLGYCILKSGSQPNQLLIVAKDRVDALEDLLGPTELIAELRGGDLVGVSYHPIFSSLSTSPTVPFKIIHAPHVTSDSGTGLVHCAPAHGEEDYHAFQALNLISRSNMLCHVDGEGRFTKGVAEVVGEASAVDLVGKEVLVAGSRAVVELLKGLGSLVKVQRVKHRYPYDWKTDKPIIVTATSQWFADLSVIKERALDALQHVSFFPPASRTRLESFVRSRTEWCISRQRVWGVPIPALHRLGDAGTDEGVLTSATLDHILTVLEEKGVRHWWDGPVEDFVPPELGEAGCEWRKGTDTMDVWFDSGTSWSMLGGLQGQGKEGRAFLADVCLEGSDQHRGWFQSQLLTAIGSASGGGSPYQTLITHGMVLDQEGKKMSKSLGNIVSPLSIVLGGKDIKKEPAYGADTLRLWAATVEYWRDMSIGPTVLAQVAESLRKIRNSARFMLGNIGDATARKDMEYVPRERLGIVERYVMHELYSLERTALEGYHSYNFPKIVNALSNFANVTLSSFYFDISKDCLYANAVTSLERRAVVTALEQVLRTMTSVLAPVLPHLAEEIHDNYRGDGTSVFMQAWVPLSEEWKDMQAVQEMAELLRIRSTVLGLLEKARRDKRLKSSLEAAVDIIIPEGATHEPLVQLLQREENFLNTLFIVSETSIKDEGSLGTHSPDWVYVDTVLIPGHDEELAIRVLPAAHEKCPRCWTFTRQQEDDLCPRCKSVVE